MIISLLLTLTSIFLLQYENLKCSKAKNIHAANIIGETITNMTSSVLQFDDTKTLILPHYFQSQNIKLDVDGPNLTFKTTSAITIPAA